MIDLKNINILVTGATGVIGNSIVKKLYENNAKIIATGTNQDKLNKLKEKYTNIIIKKFDILNHDSIEEFIDEINKIFKDKIDILINNAGITLDNLAIRMKKDEWDKVIDLNLTSTFLLSKYTIKKNVKK